jgi:very-short-patch-repair endonuclease
VSVLAGRQHGLITAAQLRAEGLTPSSITRRLERGRLHLVHRGIYSVGHRPLTPEARLHAGVLAVGPDAVLSHVSAAVLWGLMGVDLDSRRIDVTTTRRVGHRRGIRLHVTRRLPSEDVARRRNIPVTGPARTLADIAGVVAPGALRRAVREAEVQRLISLDDVRAQLRPGRRGAARLRALVDGGSAPTRSELEDRTLDLLVRHGFPRPRINATVRANGQAYEVDFLFADQRLILEADGDRYHGTQLARERDAARQADLETAGYRVIRLSWRQVTAETPRTVSRLRRVLSASP